MKAKEALADYLEIKPNRLGWAGYGMNDGMIFEKHPSQYMVFDNKEDARQMDEFMKNHRIHIAYAIDHAYNDNLFFIYKLF